MQKVTVRAHLRMFCHQKLGRDTDIFSHELSMPGPNIECPTPRKNEECSAMVWSYGGPRSLPSEMERKTKSSFFVVLGEMDFYMTCCSIFTMRLNSYIKKHLCVSQSADSSRCHQHQSRCARTHSKHRLYMKNARKGERQKLVFK